jgi:pimeloyl-ACP methyl ester carboxylesterase
MGRTTSSRPAGPIVVRRILSVPFIFLFFLLIFPSCQKQSDTTLHEIVNSVDDVDIHCQVNGSGQPALVFVHCWCCDKSFWDEQIPYFSGKYKVVSLDLGGHGASGSERETWTIASFGQDVAAVVKKLDLDEVVLIGHSMGGPVILETARRVPQRVIGLVGVDNFQNMEERYTREQFEQFLGPMRADFKKTTRQFVSKMFPPDADSNLVNRVAAKLSSAPPQVGVGAMEALFHWYREEFARAAEEIKAPLHCINSDLYPTEVEINRKYFPSFDVSLMPGKGHFVHMEDPETFNRLLEKTIQGFAQ